MGYVVIFALALTLLILTRNVQWNNWIFVGFISVTAVLFGIAIAHGFGSPLAIDHTPKKENPITEFYSVRHADLLYPGQAEYEKIDPPEQRSWMWWKLAFEFVFLTLLSIPFCFHDEWVAAWDHMIEQWQLRSTRIRRRRAQMRQEHGTPAPGGGEPHTSGFWRIMEKFLPVEIAGEIIGEGAMHLLTGILRTFGIGI